MDAISEVALFKSGGRPCQITLTNSDFEVPRLVQFLTVPTEPERTFPEFVTAPWIAVRSANFSVEKDLGITKLTATTKVRRKAPSSIQCPFQTPGMSSLPTAGHRAT